MMQKLWLVFLTGFCIIFPLAAQESDVLPEPQRVEVTVPDGLTLVGDYYAIPNATGELPSVILLHGSGGNRLGWGDVLPALLDNGFNVLAVDQRAHGETGGVRDLVVMIADVQVWLDWLREQPTVDSANIATIGWSMGTVPAIQGCAEYAACVTTIAISPGDFPTLTEEVFEALEERSILFIIGRLDNAFYDTQNLFDRTVGEAVLYAYNTSLHASGLVAPRSRYRERVINLIVTWLTEHLVE
jgi:pimeloyl-ACP methyl ester carboxylesterase